jgi:hypothetical protein
MAVRIEDAGFEIRDMIAWVYGSGFPKSLDVSKAIDKAAGAEREVVGRSENGIAGGTGKHAGQDAAYGFAGAYDITAPATDAARQWQGWGTALKPALETITVARKPLAKGCTVAANVLAHGTGAINVDGCRVATNESQSRPRGSFPHSDDAWGDGRPNEVSQTHAAGRWPANLIHDGSAEVLAGFPQSSAKNGVTQGEGKGGIWSESTGKRAGPTHGDAGSAARFFKQVSNSEDLWEGVELPRLDASTAEKNLSQQRQAAVSALVVAANSALPGGLYCSDIFLEPSTSATESELRLIASSVMQTIQSIGSKFWLEQEPARLSLSFNRASAVAIQRLTDTTTITVSHWKSDGYADPVTFSITRQSLEAGERGCALSTDGKRFIYCAKASKNDRGEGNAHPTVKPTELMRYLCRLVTPAGGVTLDPFMGSGSTGKAAMLEKFRFIGVEREPKYFDIACRRIEDAQRMQDMFAHEVRDAYEMTAQQADLLEGFA